MDRNDDVIALPQTRRDFCVQACRAGFVGDRRYRVAGLRQFDLSLGYQRSPAADHQRQRRRWNASRVTVDAASPLASIGSAALVQSSAGDFLVSRTAQDTFIALTSICTHEGCKVTGFASPVYVCPCHGSQYSTSGTVVMDPRRGPFVGSQPNSTVTC